MEDRQIESLGASYKESRYKESWSKLHGSEQVQTRGSQALSYFIINANLIFSRAPIL